MVVFTLLADLYPTSPISIFVYFLKSYWHLFLLLLYIFFVLYGHSTAKQSEQRQQSTESPILRLDRLLHYAVRQRDPRLQGF